MHLLPATLVGYLGTNEIDDHAAHDPRHIGHELAELFHALPTKRKYDSWTSDVVSRNAMVW